MTKKSIESYEAIAYAEASRKAIDKGMETSVGIIRKIAYDRAFDDPHNVDLMFADCDMVRIQIFEMIGVMLTLNEILKQVRDDPDLTSQNYVRPKLAS